MVGKNVVCLIGLCEMRASCVDVCVCVCMLRFVDSSCRIGGQVRYIFLIYIAEEVNTIALTGTRHWSNKHLSHPQSTDRKGASRLPSIIVAASLPLQQSPA